MADTTGPNSADLQIMFETLQIDFLETSEERMDEIEAFCDNLEHGRGFAADNLMEIKRSIHGIKGSAASYGFPTVSVIAHSLEDYFETTRDIGAEEVWDLRLYCDRIREIFDARVDPGKEKAGSILRGLPSRPRRSIKSELHGETAVLMVMAKGVQRKIIGRELAGFGFRVAIAADTQQGLHLALIMKPELIICSKIVDPFDGLEFANVTKVIGTTRHRKFLLMTADAEHVTSSDAAAAEASVITKGKTFSRNFFQFLKKSGLLTEKK